MQEGGDQWSVERTTTYCTFDDQNEVKSKFLQFCVKRQSTKVNKTGLSHKSFERGVSHEVLNRS